MSSQPGSLHQTAEGRRLATADSGQQDWRAWGPYLSERAWGTVREDYSGDGSAWTYFPHDHARSRAYRWNEDGLAGLCDANQVFCCALTLWNGRDPIVKERIFGLAGPEGNHGEDAKEYWWYLDSTPSHSWMTWRYHYPQREFPYASLIAENARRGHDAPEYELADTGIFDEDRYWAVTVDFAKAAPEDVCIRITVENRGPEQAAVHLLPTLWFRNTWAWGLPDVEVPRIRAMGARLLAEHVGYGPLTLMAPAGGRFLFCDNETNAQRLFGVPGRSPFPKDGIGDHVVHGAPAVNPAAYGSKAAVHHVLNVPAGQRRELRLRLVRGDVADADLGAGFDAVLRARQAEADEFFAALTPAGATADEARVLRQAIAGLMWGKQFYHYDVERWLDGDPAGPAPPRERRKGRNARWRHLNNADVISMPDPWE